MRRNRHKIEANARLLEIPITVFETDIFEIANASESPLLPLRPDSPEYLYNKARSLGCNKDCPGSPLQRRR